MHHLKAPLTSPPTLAFTTSEVGAEDGRFVLYPSHSFNGDIGWILVLIYSFIWD